MASGLPARSQMPPRLRMTPTPLRLTEAAWAPLSRRWQRTPAPRTPAAPRPCARRRCARRPSAGTAPPRLALRRTVSARIPPGRRTVSARIPPGRGPGGRTGTTRSRQAGGHRWAARCGELSGPVPCPAGMRRPGSGQGPSGAGTGNPGPGRNPPSGRSRRRGPVRTTGSDRRHPDSAKPDNAKPDSTKPDGTRPDSASAGRGSRGLREPRARRCRGHPARPRDVVRRHRRLPRRGRAPPGRPGDGAMGRRGGVVAGRPRGRIAAGRPRAGGRGQVRSRGHAGPHGR